MSRYLIGLTVAIALGYFIGSQVPRIVCFIAPAYIDCNRTNNPR